MATKVKKLEKELKTAMKDKNIVNFFNAVMVMNLYSTFSIDILKCVSSIHSYNTHQSQIDNLFVTSVHTTQYGIRSLSYTGPKLWNSLSIDIKKIKPFSSFHQYIKNSVLMVILLLLIPNCFMIILSLNGI